jgi:hypothetical protein
VDSVTRKLSRSPATTSVRSISSEGDEDANPSGQRVAVRRTASTAPGSSGGPSATRVAIAATTCSAMESTGSATPSSSCR